VDRLRPERLSLAGNARAAQVSESWLQKYVNEQYENTPKEIAPLILPEKNFSPVIECDEMLSFVGGKRNKQWLWLAIDRNTRLIVAAHIADQGISEAQGLWANMPSHYRGKAHFIGRPTKRSFSVTSMMLWENVRA
jgi:insertion element IS1 protein InsB